MPVSISLQFGILLIAAIANLALIALVTQKGKKNATSVLFGILSLTTTIWFALMFFSVQPMALEMNLLLIRLTAFIAAPMSLFFLFLSYTLPDKKFSIRGPWLIGSVIATILVMVATLTPSVFPYVVVQNGTPTPGAAPGMLLFSGLTTVYSMLSMYYLIRKYRKTSGERQRQVLLVLIGMGVMLALIISTILIPLLVFRSNFFVQFAPLYVLIYLGMTAVAILRYHLFSIKIIATELLVAMLVLFVFFEGILSGSLVVLVYRFGIAMFIGVLGSILVKSVKKEIEQRDELARLAKKLEKVNGHLKELDELKTEFLSIATHQLRTPLSIIKGYISLLEEGVYGKVTKAQREIYHNIDVSNERLVKLVDEFLDISRIEQGRTKYNFVKQSVKDIANSAIAELTEKANPKRITITPKFKSVPQIVCDEEKVRHSIFNLIDNAIKYSPTESEIRVFLEPYRAGVRVRIVDQGPGLDAKDLKNLFQKFYRSPNVSRDFEGNGLGIYVVKEFLEAHGGHVWAKSPGLGKGSEFGFVLPSKPKKKR